MMYRYFNNDFYGRSCNGFSYFNNGWSILIGLGLLIILIILFYTIVHNRNNKVYSDTVLENLKMRYVKGEITEDEYLRKKDMIGR